MPFAAIAGSIIASVAAYWLAWLSAPILFSRLDLALRYIASGVASGYGAVAAGWFVAPSRKEMTSAIIAVGVAIMCISLILRQIEADEYRKAQLTQEILAAVAAIVTAYQIEKNKGL